MTIADIEAKVEEQVGYVTFTSRTHNLAELLRISANHVQHGWEVLDIGYERLPEYTVLKFTVKAEKRVSHTVNMGD